MTCSGRTSKGAVQKLRTQTQKAGAGEALHDDGTPANATYGGALEDYTVRRKIVEEFFSSAPPLLKKAPNHTKSRKTRPPQEFDTHLHEDLILHHVVNVPSITCDLMSIAENALDCYEDFPPIDEGFPSKANRSAAFKMEKPHLMRLESDVQRMYQNTTAEFCRKVGATLAFQLPKWSPDGLGWTTSNVPDARSDDLEEGNIGEMPHASPYAIADGVLHLVPPDLAGRDPVSPEVGQTFPGLSVWEFKNMKAGDMATMETILSRFSACGRFPWEGCEHGNECLYKHDIGTTRSRMGFDAATPMCPSIGPARDSLRHKRASNPDPSPPDLKWFKYKLPRHVLQQVWAQAVKYDATFVIINSGNFEIICQRDREQQALYTSDVIEVQKCKYYKLHTGLYIAAIRDAEERAALLKKRPLPASWTFTKDLHALSEELPTRVRDLARSRNFVSMSLIKGHGRTPFVPHCGYKRVSEDAMSLRLCQDNLFKIRLHEPTGKTSILKGYLEFPGLLSDDIPVMAKIAEGVAEVELLRNEYKVHSKLEMSGVIGVAKLIGLYEHSALSEDGEEILDAVLITEDTGMTVADWLKKGDRRPFLSREQLNEYLRIKEEIHAAGYTHRCMTLDALWVKGGKNSIDVAIGGFWAAVHISKCGELNHSLNASEDHRKLLELVPNPLTRKQPADEDIPESEDLKRVRFASEPLPQRLSSYASFL